MEEICDKCKTCQSYTCIYTCKGKPEACNHYRSQEEFDKGALAYYASKTGYDNYTGD